MPKFEHRNGRTRIYVPGQWSVWSDTKYFMEAFNNLTPHRQELLKHLLP